MAEPAPNQLMTCPYNKAHQVEHYRMHIHLQKCKKQHQDQVAGVCPFDSTHIVDDAELDHHIMTCPKRVMLDSQLFITDNDHRPVVEVQTTTNAVECDDNWETTETTSYIPDPSKKGPHIITKPRGAIPSERRKARMQGIKTYRPPE